MPVGADAVAVEARLELVLRIALRLSWSLMLRLAAVLGRCALAILLIIVAGVLAPVFAEEAGRMADLANDRERNRVLQRIDCPKVEIGRWTACSDRLVRSGS